MKQATASVFLSIGNRSVARVWATFRQRVTGAPWRCTALLLMASLALVSCTPSPHDVIGTGDLQQLRTMLEDAPDLVAATNELGKQPLQYAVSFRNVEALEILLEAGADVNAADNTGLTALHVAAMLGWQEGTAWLLDHGADPHQRDSFGDLPSHTAAIHGQGGTLKVLFDHGDPLTVANNDQMTPLALAEKYRHERAARYIEKLIAG